MMKTSLWIIILLIVIIAVGLALLFEFDYLYVPLAPPENLSDIEITLERTICYGTCPAYSVTIFGDGTVIYDGKQFVRIEGKRIYDIPIEDVEKLVAEFYQIDYFSLDDRYETSVTDHPTIITSIKVGNETKIISNYADSAPARLHELEKNIDEITNSASFWDK